MKTFSLIVLCTTALLAGCESMPGRVQERFAAVPPRAQTFAAPMDKVQTAAAQAFKRLDFVITRNKVTQLVAVSRINTSAAFADSRQMVASVHLSPVGPGQTEVGITLREEVVSKSFGGTHQQDMRE
ncbi:MAG: hypothetical protein HYV75_03855, partial [Opitutae bacterium]|nr:hypothetical protein [Opitutae bacterium]